jgi:hypothetical protein
LVDTLPERMKFNGNYYVTWILEPFHKWKIHQALETTRKLIVYADNAHTHLAKFVENFLVTIEMTKVPHYYIHRIWRPQTLSLRSHEASDDRSIVF